ncbi:MAG TPA: GWxTD domain-containing protein, partial [Candidatus Kapabacteria bacterium]
TIEAVELGNEQPLLTRNIVDTIYAKNFEESISKNAWHALDERIVFPSIDSSKQYSVRIEVRDDIDRLAAHPQIATLHPPHFANASTPMGISIGDLFLADSLTATTLYTGGRGNTFMFSRNMTGIVPFVLASALASTLASGAAPSVEISVRQTKNLIDPYDTGLRFHGTVDASDLHRATQFTFASADSILRYNLAPADSDLWTAIFNVPGEPFQQGTYEIVATVHTGTVEKTQKNEFQLVWQNMPVSLEDPTDAIEPLAIIATPDQVSALNAGTTQEKRTKLYTYWKAQDPAPGTAFNERMATFYQRVDYADFNFTTGHLLNGATTDRGKVYLLYGPPTKIDRTFIPGEAPTETWTYTNNVHRVFHFEEHGQPGEYKLANIEELAASGKE